MTEEAVSTKGKRQRGSSASTHPRKATQQPASPSTAGTTPRPAVPVVERATLPIAALNAAHYNPRRISDEALAGLDASIGRFGVVQDIIVNRRNGKNIIVGGHQRVKALVARGVTEVPVAFVDLDPIEEKALNIALNSPHISGEFTDDLQTILGELALADEGLVQALRLDELMIALVDKEPAPLDYETKFELTVELPNEAEQQDLYERLSAEGYAVKILSI